VTLDINGASGTAYAVRLLSAYDVEVSDVKFYSSNANTRNPVVDVGADTYRARINHCLFESSALTVAADANMVFVETGVAEGVLMIDECYFTLPSGAQTLSCVRQSDDLDDSYHTVVSRCYFSLPAGAAGQLKVGVYAKYLLTVSECRFYGATAALGSYIYGVYSSSRSVVSSSTFLNAAILADGRVLGNYISMSSGATDCDAAVSMSGGRLEYNYISCVSSGGAVPKVVSVTAVDCFVISNEIVASASDEVDGAVYSDGVLFLHDNNILAVTSDAANKAVCVYIVGSGNSIDGNLLIFANSNIGGSWGVNVDDATESIISNNRMDTLFGYGASAFGVYITGSDHVTIIGNVIRGFIADGESIRSDAGNTDYCIFANNILNGDVANYVAGNNIKANNQTAP
jgi:hypothetical protein